MEIKVYKYLQFKFKNMWKFIKKLFEHKNKDGGTVRKIDFAQCYIPPIRKEIILLRDLAETLNIGLQLKDKTLAINQYELIVKHCENQIENLKKNKDENK